MKRILSLFTAVIFFAISFLSCSKDQPPGPQELTLSEKLQKALDDGLNSERGKGISAAVIMPDGWMWSGASGISYGTTKLTTDMKFAAGSIGKIFTAATIIQLAESNQLSLNDSIFKWLPSYPYVDSTITIRQLLNHTSGLFDIADNHDFWQSIFAEPSKVRDPENIIQTFNRPALFPKGTGWNYSTTGYILLRLIIQEITGENIFQNNKDRFWTTLGLSNSSTSMEAELPDNVAHSWYDIDNNGTYDDFFNWSRAAFVSGICGEVWSTPLDLAKWARAMFHDKTVVSQTSLNEMLSFYSPCTGEETVCAGYGLGVVNFNPQILNGLRAYGHSGNAPGYAAASIYLPDYDVCMGIMDNTEEGESIQASMDNLIKVITDQLSNQ